MNRESMIFKESVVDVIKRVFPAGTFPENPHVLEKHNSKAPNWKIAPVYPTDMFAVCAHLLNISPAYRWFIMEEQHHGDDDKCVSISQKSIEACSNLGKKWRKRPFLKEVQTRWEKLYSDYGSEQVISSKLNDGDFSKSQWCQEAYELMIIADEACINLAFLDYANQSVADGWFEELIRAAYFEKMAKLSGLEDEELKGGEIKNDESHHIISPPSTMTINVNRDVVSVQCKARVSSVGCTARSLSQYLAILPRPSHVRTCWQPSLARGRSNDNSALNLLLIPMPYSMNGGNFSAVKKPKSAQVRNLSWGFFDVNQSWLNSKDLKWRKKFNQFVLKLIEEGQKELGTVHGIVFPELALNWQIYESLVEEIKTSEICKGIEFIISGSENNCIGQNGNFALSTEFYDDPKAGRQAVSMSRAKHHRWKLDTNQINNYALASSLDPRKNWWEKINLYPREIKLNVFRQNSVFGVLICEDLARSDPCHEVLRAMGPNLVFALLMDGPQILGRWGSNYATMLADDPGCSVLTFTSQALLRRVNHTQSYKDSWAVALWKDPLGGVKEIKCPDGNHAVLLTLSSNDDCDETLCGRSNSDAKSWTFHHQLSISIDDEYVPETLI